MSLSLLGTASDVAIGRKLERTDRALPIEREQLGVPEFILRWTDDGDSWLSADGDRAFGIALGRTQQSVRARRQRLGIPSYRDE